MAKVIEPASLVHAKYPHTGDKHALVPDGDPNGGWWEHELPDGRIANVAWLYEGNDDARRRTILVRVKGDTTNAPLMAHNVALGAPLSHMTNKLLAQL